MQVIMALGLFSKWKQPTYIGFDKNMTQDLLDKLITKVYDIKYKIGACVSDCGGGNMGYGRSWALQLIKHIIFTQELWIRYIFLQMLRIF